MLGAPLSEGEWPADDPLREVPAGCTSQLVYKDEYVRAYARALASQVISCGGTWLHVCFDADGRYVDGRHAWTMIQC
jgi:hypothetical protein